MAVRSERDRRREESRAASEPSREPIHVTATEAQNEFGRVLSSASSGRRVVISRHQRPTAVLLSVEDYNELAQAVETVLDTLSEEFDELLERMQTPEFRGAMERAFGATPEELGAAAVRAVRKGE